MHNFIGTLLSSIVKGALIKECENVIKAQSPIKVLWSKLRTHSKLSSIYHMPLHAKKYTNAIRPMVRCIWIK